MKTLMAILLMTVSLAWANEAFLGVVLEDEPTNLDAYGESGLAVRVESVVSGSPAEKAGMRGGDLFLKFAGKAVSDRDDLSFYLGKRKPGESVELQVLRSGEKRTLTAKLGEKSESKRPTVMVMGKEVGGTSGFLGVTTLEVNNNLLEYFGVTEGYGVLVDGVIAKSSAERNGIKVGDVIVQIDEKRVDSIGRLGRITRSYEPGTTIKVLIYRDGKPRTLSLAIGKRDHSSLKPPVAPGADGPWLETPLYAAESGVQAGLDASERVLNGLESTLLHFAPDEAARNELRLEMDQARFEIDQERKELRRDMQDVRREVRGHSTRNP